MCALSPQEKAATPAQEFDEEILVWVHGRADEEGTPIGPTDPQGEDAEIEEQRARLRLQKDLDQAVQDGFSVTGNISIILENDDEGSKADVEIVPEVHEWGSP